MIDVQIYNRDKQIFGRKDLTWEEAHFWLENKRNKLKDFTSIEIQIYTSEGMPVDSKEVKFFDDAHEFIYKVLNKARAKKYNGVYLL